MNFEHMLLNLLRNAYKYNGKDVRIKVIAKNHKLYFIDYGNGISKDILPYIFDRFYTIGNGGTGLGLALCKMVMESIGGNISCKSRLERYTKFIMVFPKIAIKQV